MTNPINVPDVEPPFASRLADVLAEVWAERFRQDMRWGEQNHAFISGATIGEDESVRREYAARADSWRSFCNEKAKLGEPTWDAILLEEVYEALSEKDETKREEELIQVAAVAVAMVECSRRNRE